VNDKFGSPTYTYDLLQGIKIGNSEMNRVFPLIVNLEKIGFQAIKHQKRQNE